MITKHPRKPREKTLAQLDRAYAKECAPVARARELAVRCLVGMGCEVYKAAGLEERHIDGTDDSADVCVILRGMLDHLKNHDGIDLERTKEIKKAKVRRA